jgi:hypothetical protein
MEWWILLGLAVVALVIGVSSRIRKSRRHAGERETQNIYPLW